MYVKQILTSRAICQLQIPADCSILNRRSDQLGQKQKKMRFCIHKLIFRSEKTSRNTFICGSVSSFVGWSARKIEIVKSTIFINNDPIYHQSKVCSSSPYNDIYDIIYIWYNYRPDQTRPDQTRQSIRSQRSKKKFGNQKSRIHLVDLSKPININSFIRKWTVLYNPPRYIVTCLKFHHVHIYERLLLN